MQKSVLIQAGRERLKTRAINAILSYFKGKTYIRIIIFDRQDLLVGVGIGNVKFRVKEILSDSHVLLDARGMKSNKIPLKDISLNDLISILKQLENMKGYNQLKKP